MIKENEILTFEDGKKFNVIHSFMMDNTNYVFLYEEGNPRNVLYAKFINDEIVTIDDEEELKKYYERLKEEML